MENYIFGKGGQKNVPPFTEKPSKKKSKRKQSAPPGYGSTNIQHTDIPSPGELGGAMLETSTASASAVAGTSQHDKRKKYMIDRTTFLEELELRSIVQEILKITKDKKKRPLNEELELRKLIKVLIKEAKQEIPFESTGINVLEKLLKRIVPDIESGYKSLTTSIEQRNSFKNHILHAIVNTIAPLKALPTANQEQDMLAAPPENLDSENEVSEQDLKMSIDKQDDSKDNDKKDKKFIDIEKDKSEEEQEKTKFELTGEDKTGRNIAFSVFRKIKEDILKSYMSLENKEDQDVFYSYLLTNVNLYFDKFEDELINILPNITTVEYEREKERKKELEI